MDTLKIKKQILKKITRYNTAIIRKQHRGNIEDIKYIIQNKQKLKSKLNKK